MNGGGIRASLYQGDVLGADLAAVCPYSNTIVLVEAEGRVIEAMLENGISQTIRDSEIPAGPVPSGFRAEICVSPENRR